MQDGQTRKLTRSNVKRSLFLARHRASLVEVDGPAAGTEYALTAESAIIGRGPQVDILIDDDSMSRQHAAIELLEDGFRIRDMGSTNGVTVNGSTITGADLKHGDHVALGERTLQYLIERCEQVGTYDLSGEVDPS
jgi:pSer/pThr/pTyr-binding forkhead associated (FHA) protein